MRNEIKSGGRVQVLDSAEKRPRRETGVDAPVCDLKERGTSKRKNTMEKFSSEGRTVGECCQHKTIPVERRGTPLKNGGRE